MTSLILMNNSKNVLKTLIENILGMYAEKN